MLMQKGNMADVQKAVSVGQIVDYDGASHLNAEIVAGETPLWHVIETLPNHERSVGAHLVGRRFGMFVPETEETIVRRGRKRKLTRVMFTGYVFVFVWNILRHQRRIESVPGVARIIFVDGHPAVISDRKIDEIRAVENQHRPLPATMLYDDGIAKKKKARWRRTPKTARELEADGANDIVAVRPWSAFQDALISLDGPGRNQTLRTALGLPS